MRLMGSCPFWILVFKELVMGIWKLLFIVNQLTLINIYRLKHNGTKIFIAQIEIYRQTYQKTEQYRQSKRLEFVCWSDCSVFVLLVINSDSKRVVRFKLINIVIEIM